MCSSFFQIMSIFEDALGYPCMIDSIAEDENDKDISVVEMHFIDEELNEPVKADVIIQ